MQSKPLPAEDLAAVVTTALASFHALRDARLFLTGGTGFFGHWLLESLLLANREHGLKIRATVLTRDAARFREGSPWIANDEAITLLEGDVRSFEFPAEPHSHVVHAATDSGGQQDEGSLAAEILEGTRRVLEFAQQTGAARLLYTSSGAVYGRGITDVREIAETYPLNPSSASAYDAAKKAAEEMIVASAVDAVIARCFAFVGPRLPLDAHFAIGNFIGDAMASRRIHIKGDGTPLRSYLYMSDLAAWLFTMLTQAQAGSVYNVGSDEAVSIAELARTTAAVLRPGLAIQIDGTPQVGAAPASYVPSLAKARVELGLKVTVALHEAIRKTAAWYA